MSENEVCKVADLDLCSESNRLEEEEDGLRLQEGVSDPNRILRWRAPETLKLRYFSTASDVWSYGVVLWEMFNPSLLPYPDCDDRMCVERILDSHTLDVPLACPERVAKIMRACWYQSPACRPSFLYISSLISCFITENYNRV